MRILSCIQPSGELHIGNYLGMIKQALELQKTEECFYFVVDLHALTENPKPDELRNNIVRLVADLLALGFDPARSTFFIQSHVPEHTELMWLLTGITPVGELERMTQYKDKSQRAGSAGVNAGLLMYPVLMAADILLYKAEGVPVGEDQLQHLELARTLARKFNDRFAKIFPEPQPLITKETARIISLQDPSKKMSKSVEGSYLGIFEDPESIRKKIQRAVTDSGKDIVYDPQKKPALANLLSIYHGISGMEFKEIEREFRGKDYASFKAALADRYVQFFSNARARRKIIEENPERVHMMLEKGTQHARNIATATMQEARKAVGIR